MKEIQRYDVVYDGIGTCPQPCNLGSFVYFDDVEPLIEQNKAMLEMLKSLEFSDWNANIDEWCCHMCCQHGEHAPDCKFAKLIGGDKDDDLR